ncbi:MAG: arginyltransferase [Methylococcaceae bacterium]|nr:arginyltransferase [Methylococcaceae bacterium]MCI0668020.1 arginyltransferase [Methylococcaceae bacterium]MCI0732825.1 arginyltransferase [Methylococcaceae bacterium]
MQAKPLQFVLGNEHDCDYLPGRSARSVFLISDRDHARNDYQTLIRQGFRRSGDLIYRPYCRECKACIPVRIPVERFRPSRKQRRTSKKNADLRVTGKPPDFNPVHFELYRRYLNARHPDGVMGESGPEDYIRFLSSEWAGTRFYEFTFGSRVVAVAVVDHLDDALSAVYTFFEPQLAKRSLGSFAILWEIQETRRLGLPFLYLGYWIGACVKMAYKNDYRPIEGHIEGRWQLINDR